MKKIFALIVLFVMVSTPIYAVYFSDGGGGGGGGSAFSVTDITGQTDDTTPATTATAVLAQGGSLIESTLAQIGTAIGAATINDSAGNGDTTVVWSADKVFDQLALKAPASGIALTALANQAAQTINANATDSAAAPTAIAISASQVVARLASGNIKGASTAEMKTLLGYPTSGDYQPALGVLAGTLTNGYYCTYTSSGTLLSCNTQYTTASNFVFGSDARGDMVRRGASAYERVAKGTANQIWAMDSSATDPGWTSTLAISSIALTGNLTGTTPPVVVLVPSGVHDGGDNQAIMTDGGIDIGANALIGMTVYNVTDGSSCTITANAATTITCTLAGGTQNDWDNNDVWQVGPGPAQAGSMFYVAAAGTLRWPTTVGYSGCVMAEANPLVKIDFGAAMVFTGTLNTAVESTSAGDYIASSDTTDDDFMCIHNKTATLAKGMGKRGTWSQE